MPCSMVLTTTFTAVRLTQWLCLFSDGLTYHCKLASLWLNVTSKLLIIHRRKKTLTPNVSQKAMSIYTQLPHTMTHKVVFHVFQHLDILLLVHSMHMQHKPKQHCMYLPFCTFQWVQSLAASTATVLPSCLLFCSSCQHTLMMSRQTLHWTNVSATSATNTLICYWCSWHTNEYQSANCRSKCNTECHSNQMTLISIDVSSSAM